MNFTPLFILYLFVLQSIVQHFIDTECYKPFKGPIKQEPRYRWVCIAKYDKYVQVFKIIVMKFVDIVKTAECSA